MSFSLIACVGKNGDLCFHLPSDLKFFKKTTLGSTVFMGLNTWKSLKGPLPGRKNLVLSDIPVSLPDGVELVSDLPTFIKKYSALKETVFVIGGASVYVQLLPFSNTLYLTEVDASDPDADVFFPTFDHSPYNRELLGSGEDNGIKFNFIKYTKKG